MDPYQPGQFLSSSSQAHGDPLVPSGSSEVSGPAEEEVLDELALTLVPGVGPRMRQRLLDYFGSARAVLEASKSQLTQVPEVGPQLAAAIRAAADRRQAQQVLALCQQEGIRLVCQSDPAYPPLLKQIADPPGLLFLRGEILPRDQVAIAIVGTRHPSLYGLRQAERLARSLARAGVTIVSGLARGIDAAAHRGALAASGRTLAVLASGVLTIYPPEHKELAEQIIPQGALVSEAPPAAEPLPGTFPQRNRLISGLSLGVVVVEAPHRSGALITAHHAAEQNREVFAVPGRVDDPTSHGCHRLIREGAKLVESAEDILEELGPLIQPTEGENGRLIHHPAELLLSPTEQTVLDAIGTDPTEIDQIVRTTGLPVPKVLSTLSVLEMRHLIRRLGGTSVARR